MVSVQVRPPSALRIRPFGIPAQTTAGLDGSTASANTRAFRIGPAAGGVQLAPPSVDLNTPALTAPA